MKRKTALVTGASRGIGMEIATLLAKEGYDLVLNCKTSISALNDLALSLMESYHVRTFVRCGDIGDYSFVSSMFQDILQFTQGIDVLVNNAGISYIGLISDMNIEDWNLVIQTNLTSVFSCCKHSIPHMVSQKQGKIINISSVWGCAGASYEVAYSASKGAVNTFTKALAKELAPSNIQVNAIACGIIDTSMNACFTKEEQNLLLDEIPAGRLGTALEAAQMTLSLIHSPAYLTGQVISMDGGWI